MSNNMNSASDIAEDLNSLSSDPKQTLLQISHTKPGSDYSGYTTPADMELMNNAVFYETTKSSFAEFSNRHPELLFQRKYYRFVRTLGDGSTATVIEADWLPKGRKVAIKIIEKDRIKKYVESIKVEVDILSQVDHPNLLGLLDWGFSKKAIYLVTELAEGGELFDRILDNGHFDENDACVVLYTVIDAMKYLHSRNIIHRDIKPENIFMRDKNHTDYTDIVLGDFGMSTIIEHEDIRVHTQLGTCGYIAPEILLNEGYGKPCDIWSLGVMTYVLLTGMSPFRGDSFERELNDIMRGPLRMSEWFWADISSEAKDFTRNCLRIAPQRRPTAAECLQHPWFSNIKQKIEISGQKPVQVNEIQDTSLQVERTIAEASNSILGRSDASLTGGSTPPKSLLHRLKNFLGRDKQRKTLKHPPVLWESIDMD